MYASLNMLLLVLFLYTEALAIRPKGKIQAQDLHHKMTEEEFMMYFGASPASSIPHYDISYLTYVNELGGEISGQRMKRDAANQPRVYLDISLFGMDLHLNLTVNEHLLAPYFHIEYRHKNGSRTLSVPTHRNFFHGHVVSHPHSTVALSGEHSLSGTVTISNKEIFLIHPLPEHLSKNYEDVKGRRAHLIVKRETLDDGSEKNNDIQEVYSQKSKFLEVTYIADYIAIEQFGLVELQEILLSIGNIVSNMFYDGSFGKQKVIYVINKIILANNDEFSYPRDESRESKYYKMTEWFGENNGQDDTDPSHSDQAMLFTSLCTGGVGAKGVLCQRNDASGLVSLTSGLSTAFMVAHETFHNFGYGHDTGTINANCSNGAAIMSTFLPSGRAASRWSPCSSTFVQTFLKSDDSRCLDDPPTAKGPTQTPILRQKLPGVVFDANRQCEMIFGIGMKHCSAYSNDCSSLYCTDDEKTCKYILAPPADGTRCGERHWCIKAECVDDGSPTVNGNWGAWSRDVSPCTRTCGSGVQHRTRKCDKPSPQNGGMLCVGSDIGEYRTCNKQPCEPGAISFRLQQCQTMGYMKVHSSTRKGTLTSGCIYCSLWCSTSNNWNYRSEVIDGTRCSEDVCDNDICVNKKCESVGCDGEYHSGKEMDRCGVCDGDGSTCVLRTLEFTEHFSNNAYRNLNPLTVVVLKNGSSNIYAKKKKDTWNYLGVLDMTGEFLIPIPSWSTIVTKAGTKIVYKRDHYQYADEILTQCPITQDLKLVLTRYYEQNQGVDVRYYEPVQNVTERLPDTLFVWKTTQLSPCSKPCAGGIIKLAVKCLRSDDNTVVGERFCTLQPRPVDEYACNIHECPPEWHVTPWTPCSRTCGKGSQIRNIVCRRMTVNSWIVQNDTECIDPRPQEPLRYRNCNEILCPSEWVGLPWTECSTKCGAGNSTRKLECRKIDEMGEQKNVAAKKCEVEGAPLPPTIQRCNYDVACPVPQSQYVSLGCYKDTQNNRVFPELLENLRPTINWQDPEATVKECAVIAYERNKTYFAVQFYGECRSYVGHDPHVDYTMHGLSSNFWCGLGGEWTNCIYKFS